MSSTGVGALGGERGGLGRRGPAGQRLLGGRGPQRRRPHVGQRDPAVDGGDADDRPVVGPADELLVAPAGCPAGAAPGPRRAARPGSSAVSKNPAKKSSAATLRGRRPGPCTSTEPPEREQRHRQVGRRVGVRQRAADRAAVPDLRVADQRRRRGPAAAPRRRTRSEAASVGVRGWPRRSTSSSPSTRMPVRSASPADVDQHRRAWPAAASSSAAASGRRPAASRRRRARPSSSRACLGRLGGDVVERRGDHALASPLPPAAASTARTMLW